VRAALRHAEDAEDAEVEDVDDASPACVKVPSQRSAASW
jgi:hypothetical protein